MQGGAEPSQQDLLCLGDYGTEGPPPRRGQIQACRNHYLPKGCPNISNSTESGLLSLYSILLFLQHRESESVPGHLPLTWNSCVLGCEGWMYLQGTLVYLTQVPGKEAKPETALMCTSKLVWLHLGWPRPILSPCDRDAFWGTRPPLK